MENIESEELGFDVRELESEDASRRNISEPERIISAIAGGVLVAFGLSRGRLGGAALAAAGGALLYRGATAHCPFYERLDISTALPRGTECELARSITVNRPRAEVYRFFRNFENFPRFMRNLEAVISKGPGRTHWVMRIPGGRILKWDAVIIEEREPELIRWRSLEGSDLDHHGEVWFDEAPGGRGTELRVSWKYLPPGAVVGAIAAKLMEGINETKLQEELRRFKQVMETGEVSTIEGQTSGRMRVADLAREIPLLPPIDDTAFESEDLPDPQWFEEDISVGEMELASAGPLDEGEGVSREAGSGPAAPGGEGEEGGR